MTTILCGLPAFQPMHQPGFPAPAAGDKKFNSRLVAPTWEHQQLVVTAWFNYGSQSQQFLRS
jgi:hypothetical protein